MIKFYYIVRCSQCGTPQYIREDQKTRTCPKCRKRIKCNVLKKLANAQSAQEAIKIVQSLKTPNKYEAKIELLKSRLQGSKRSNESVFGNLISELLLVFPNQLPKKELLVQASKLDITEEEVESFLEQLNKKGLVLINKDFRPNHSGLLLKFPSIPFTFGKISVKKVSKKKL